MKFELAAEKLRPLRVQIIEAEGGAILKRGRTEIEIAGDGASEALRTLLESGPEGVTRQEIVERFAPPERPGVESLVDYLIGRQILIPVNGFDAATAPPESDLDVFYWHFEARPGEVRERLAARRFHVFGVNQISRRLVAGLRASGVESIEVLDDPELRNAAPDGAPEIDAQPFAGMDELDPESLDCVVAASDLGGTNQLRLLNEYCILHDLHFLPIALQDLVGYVGPLVVPGESPCYECLRSRQNAHLGNPRSQRAAEAALLPGDAVSGYHPSMAGILGDVAAIELTKFFGLGPRAYRIGSLVEVNLLGSEMKARTVLRLPRCPVCSALKRQPSPSLTRAELLPDEEDES